MATNPTQGGPSVGAEASGAAAGHSSTRAEGLRRLLVGNWVGAAMVAVITATTAGLLSVALAALLKPTDFGLDNSLTLVAVLMTGAFGANLNASFDVMGYEASGSLAAFPFTITVASLAVAVWVFRRSTRRYPRGIEAIGDAARASVIFGLLLMAVSLIFRADSKEFGRGWGAELAQMFDVRIVFSASVLGAFFLGTLILFLTLLATSLVRGGWWSGTAERVRSWLAAPLYGIGVFAALMPLAGLIGLGLLMISGDSVDETTDVQGSDLRFSIGLVAAVLANGGMWLMGLGSGSAFGYSAESDGDVKVELHHLPHFASDSPGLWAAPLVVLLVLMATAFLVARRAPRHRVLPDLVAWVAAVLVTTPLLVRVANLHVSLMFEGDGQDSETSAMAGLVGWQTTLLLTLVAIVCAAVMAWLKGALDVAQLRTRGQDFARTVQRNPGRPGQPPP